MLVLLPPARRRLPALAALCLANLHHQDRQGMRRWWSTTFASPSRVPHTPTGRANILLRLHPNLLTHLPSRHQPGFRDVQVLAAIRCLHTDKQGFVLFVCTPTITMQRAHPPLSSWSHELLDHEDLRLRCPMLVRRDTNPKHARTFFWWIWIDICTQWWLRHCFKCRAHTLATSPWPVIPLSLSNGPGQTARFDYIEQLSVTQRENLRFVVHQLLQPLRRHVHRHHRRGNVRKLAKLSKAKDSYIGRLLDDPMPDQLTLAR